MKTRTFQKREKGVPREHPDGGVFYLLPLDGIRAAAVQDELEAVDYERDENGKVLIGDDKKPVQKVWQSDSERIAAKVKIIRAKCVTRVGNFIDADDPKDAEGNAKQLTMTDEMIEAVLSEMSERKVEHEFPRQRWDEELKRNVLDVVDGKVMTEKRTVPAKEMTFEWVLAECMKLGASGQEEEKNFSSTQS